MPTQDFEVIENSPGLWRWVIRRPDRVAPGLINAFVCFETKAEAADDFAIHAAGHIDETGRWVLPKAHVQNLVRAIAAPCAECADIHFGGVYWHEPDDDGCNWSVSTLRGLGAYAECMACVQPAAIQLRRRYAIPGER
jgi:hypothetical protein